MAGADGGSIGAGEYSWGPGLTPPGCENMPPNEGGRYQGTTPPVGSEGVDALREEFTERWGKTL